MPEYFCARLGDNHLLPFVQVGTTADDLLRLVLTAFHDAYPELIGIRMVFYFQNFTHNDIVKLFGSVNDILYFNGSHG